MIGSDHNALLHLHVEHQSDTDKSMVLRTLDYAGSLLLRDHTRKGSARATPVPPLLIQFVVSNDPLGWRAAKNLDDLYDLDPELHEAYQALRIRHRYLVWEQTVQKLRNESFVEALLIQVEARFGAAPGKLQLDRINSATRAQITHWIKHCASAPSLDQLLELAP